MFHEWTCWFDRKKLKIREFNLFQIMWDNGAWWGLDLEYSKPSHDNEMKVGKGNLNCFFQITILGIGIRYSYKKRATVVLPSMDDVKRMAQSK